MPKLFQPLRSKIAIRISLSLVAAYLGISAVAAYLLTIPKRVFNPNAVSAFTTPPQTIRFSTSDGVSIAAWFAPFKGSDRAVILVHGLNSSRTAEFGGHFAEIGAALQRQGFTVLMIDLRGHGQSGDVRLTFGLTERRDVIGAVNWLKSQGFQPGKIGALGVSMGAASVIGAAAEDSDIGAIVEDSGYAEVYPVLEKNWSSNSGLPNIFLPPALMFADLLTGYNLVSAKPVQEIVRIPPRPVLIIHSTIDPFTPISHAYQLKNADPSAEFWKTSAPEHVGSYTANPQAYVRRVINFFGQNLK